MNLYPRSFLRLILVGWWLGALPLLAAVAFASISFNDIAVRSANVVQQASLTARLGWELPEQLSHMERSLRQYEVLRDRSLLDDYAASRREWRQSSEEFARIPLLVPLAGRIGAMLAAEDAAYAKLATAGTAPLRETLVAIKGQAFGLLDEAGQRIDGERNAFSAEADALRQRVLITLAVAFGLAGAMFWLGRRLLAKLLSRFERAVVALGQNRLERRIRLKGPEDLQWVGRRLDWLRRRLLALEQQRNRILRHVSHELKTPLAALREGASLLHEGVAGPLSPQQAKIAGIMQGNALRLQRLIDSLLKMQQAGYLRDRIEPVPLRLDELIQQILATHQLAARNKHLHVSGTLAPLTVAGGREELTTIIDNLVSNAIKFSPDGGQLRLTLTQEGESAVLDVIDDGPGVPEADREKIFEPFYRSPASRGVAGVGLGLAIAREFVAAHRGTLDLVATTAGTHFRATLPLAGADA
ncbi:sensor histidine kinase [Sulfurisoma sediminicola]|uniref:histidine kinase n=1 Tax=Sulfurisoma sediminicola TaxID=1381557 RepID=A0A497XB96_9PROT|nr:HAMP domain-containing sensor histidine kinase [Sulfurisoma sediminicola]RLJ63529.1 signal transduction histidine kinase [Sulfurisoma sediminicola]